MRLGRKSFLSLVLMLGIVYSNVASAEEYTGWGKIISVENGWQGEGVAILHSIASIKGCAADSNDFAIDKNHPSYKELVAIALAAFTSQSDVQLVVDKGVCIFGARTKIISIQLKK
ncbi:hypothetical protein [Xanthomonas arboricola]|uniref:hypothetical protein n=1 Tax=Xanthomonas arboricola TaxID=56448 RepID=UPI003EC0CEF5